MGLLQRFISKKMGNNCLKTHTRLDVTNEYKKEAFIEPKKTSKKPTGYGHRRLGSTASTVSGDDIKLVWANNKDSSTLFDRLGAKDIFKRFNNFLENWKTWQDEERLCKEMLGFDLEKHLVESLCVIPSGMRIGLGYGCTTEEYDFYLDVDPTLQLHELCGHLSCTLQKAIELFKSLSQQMKALTEQGEKICQDLTKILEHMEDVGIHTAEISATMPHLDNPEQLRHALLIVKDVVVTLKSYGTIITNYIMQQGHNVDIVVSNKKSSNPKLVIFPKRNLTKIKVYEMDATTFARLSKGEDDEKYIEISFK